MEQHVIDFLARQKQSVIGTTEWDDGKLPLQVTTYVSDELPPLEVITSVRAIVRRDGEVLVVRDPFNEHILPGGRREDGESLIETLRREVLEETGWHLDSSITLVGFIHLHNLNPEHWAKTDFFQAVYTAEAIRYEPEAKEVDGFELGSEFRPLAVIQQLPISEGERLLLDGMLALDTSD